MMGVQRVHLQPTGPNVLASLLGGGEREVKEGEGSLPSSRTWRVSHTTGLPSHYPTLPQPKFPLRTQDDAK